MATTTGTKPRKSAAETPTPARGVSTQRKREVIGLLIMAIGVLLSLAIATYDRHDAVVLDISSPAPLAVEDTATPNNKLGIIGAAIARVAVGGFLGYHVLVFTLLLILWGYRILRHRPARPLPWLTVLATIGAIVVASIAGWFHHQLETDLTSWSGAWGLSIAQWTRHELGRWGSIILFGVLFTSVVLLAVEHDIQRSLDRIEDLFRSVRAYLASWRERWQIRRADRQAAREQARAELARQRSQQQPPARVRETLRPDVADRPAGPVRNLRSEAAERPALRPEHPAPPPPRESTYGLSTDLFGQPSRPPSNPMGRPEDLPGGPALKVRERVEEEKAAPIGRTVDASTNSVYAFPPLDLLDEAEDHGPPLDFAELEENKQVLLDKLGTYNIEIVDIDAIVGPTVTLYELTPAPGVKISRITALEDDLAMAMAARGIRMIAPIPGKSAIGVEIPNRKREMVRIRDVIGTARFRDARMELPVTIGKSIEGEVFLEDLTKMPHLLIAGATGSGKSVGLNTLIAGLLYACSPASLKFVMIDPKKIELQQYARIVDHYIAMPPNAEDPIITDFTQALGVLKSCEKEMERRYDLLSKATVRGIKDYNKKVVDGKLRPEDGHRHLPYIVVIVDELADLMMTAGKDIEGPIARLAQMARAVGIHLVLATQRPSVDVITGLIKANFPSRIAYQVASKVDSRTILDQNGAEGLVGNGDLLYMNGSRLVRLQGPFVSVDEVEEITQYISGQPGNGPYILPPVEEPAELLGGDFEGTDEADDLFADAARIIVRSQQGSVSLLQRKLSIGYSRAARIVDQLEDAGIVGPFEGSKARQVLVESEEQLDDLLSNLKS